VQECSKELVELAIPSLTGSCCSYSPISGVVYLLYFKLISLLDETIKV